MTGYSTEYKEMIVKRMLGEDAVSVSDLVTETGVSRVAHFISGVINMV
jgi:hypothetical protein